MSSRLKFGQESPGLLLPPSDTRARTSCVSCMDPNFTAVATWEAPSAIKMDNKTKDLQ